MPVLRNISSANRTAENGLPGRDNGLCPSFSLEGTWAVRFRAGRQANAMRSEAGGFAKEVDFYQHLVNRIQRFP